MLDRIVVVIGEGFTRAPEAYYAIVLGGWLWNQWAPGAGLKLETHPLHAPQQLT